MLQLRLLGRFQLFIDNQTITISKPRQREIIAYLGLHYPASVTRLSLATHLWPETNDAQSLANLRGHLLHLSRELPQLKDYLQWDDTEFIWHVAPQTVIDVIDFKRHLQNAFQSSDENFIRAEFESAITLYEGGLCPDSHNEWIVEERERLRDQFLQLLERLGGSYEAARRYREASQTFQRLLRFEPQSEEAYRHLMRLHTLLGEMDEVRRIYQKCEQVLNASFGVRPSTLTSELFTQLIQADEQALSGLMSGSVLGFELIGREPQWKKMQQCWGQVLRNRPHCIILEGELGIGKSRLLEERDCKIECVNGKTLRKAVK